MSSVASLENTVLSEEDELSNLLSNIRLGSKSLSRATSSRPPTSTRSLRDVRQRRPPPVGQVFAPSTPSPHRISVIPQPATNIFTEVPSVQSADQSDESDDDYTDARSHLSSEYGNSSLDNTIASISRGDLLAAGDEGPEALRNGSNSSPPSTPSRNVATGTDDNPVYSLSSPTRNGLVNSWSTAGHHALPHPSAHVNRLTPRRARRHRPFRFHVIVKGLSVGVYECHWNEVKGLTDGVGGALYKGFSTRQEAECAYIISYGLGIVQELRGSSSASSASSCLSIVNPQPTEAEILDALGRAASLFLGIEWYAVFKGVRPGVYPTWLAVGNLVQGVSTATHKRFSTKEAAEQCFRRALRNGEVRALERGVSYII